MASLSIGESDVVSAEPHPKKNHLLRIALGGLLLIAAVGVLIERRTRPRLIAGPMVQMPAPRSLAVVWKMDAPIGDAQVRLNTSDGQSRVVRAEVRHGRYEVVFDGLAAGTTCTYTIENRRFALGESQVAGPIEVKTPAARGSPFRFVVFGDSGNGSNTQADLATRIAGTLPEAILHVGDLIYPSGSRETYQTHFFEPNAQMLRRAMFMPSLGNHDVATEQGRPLLETFLCPHNGPAGIEAERNYWFDYGDARFVALDSNLVEFSGALTAEQMKSVVAPWVRGVLNDCDARWKFVFFHHPFYTGSTHAAEGAAYVKEAYVAVFEECGVDMVFCGHNHLYERTAPIRADKIVPDGAGIVYITTGAGGSTRYPEIEPPPPYIRTYNDRVFSFTQVDLSADRLELRQIDENGEIIDEYMIEKTRPSPVGERPPLIDAARPRRV